MRRAAALVVVVLGCGNHAGPAQPQQRPVVRLVRCVAATPPPTLAAPIEDEAGAFKLDDGEVTFSLASKRAVSLGTLTTTGDTAKLAPLVRTKLGELTKCYVDGPLRAAVVYRFTINGDGRVGKVEATSNILGKDLDACVKRVLATLVFPRQPAAVLATLPLVFDSTGTFAPADKSETTPGALKPWTPFAINSAAPTAAATSAARATEPAVRARLAAIDGCFTGASPAGSLRLMIELGVGGDLDGVRVGGLGDARGEACVAKALGELKIVLPVDEYVEVACDLARGDAQTWRIAPGAGYSVIEADRAQLRHGGKTLVPGTSEPEALPVGTYVVVAQRDTPGAMLQLALLWAADAHAVVLALADGNAPPVFLGIGQGTVAGEDAAEAVRAALRVNGKTVTSCVGRVTHEAKLADPSAVSAAVNKIAAKCRTMACSPTLLVAIDSDAVAKDLVEISGAARRAGFDRVLLGGSELGCAAGGKPAPGKSPPISGPDFEEP